MPDNNGKEKLVIGLMSGTSLDGIDAAIIKSDGKYVKRWGKCYHMDYTYEQRAMLKLALSHAKDHGHPTKEDQLINETENLVTDLHIDAVNGIMKVNNLSGGDVDLIGFHGQTLLHGPEKGWSWQIGNGHKLAENLGIPVVNDLRRNDVENGGQGAPLVPIYHRAIIEEKTNEFPVALINIGGVSNITWMGSCRTEDLIAFDAGPGNALLDDFIRRISDLPFDRDGTVSAKGNARMDMVAKWMTHDYFYEKPPKSLDRDEFNVSDVNGLSPEDGAATLCAFSVAAIKAGANICPSDVKRWYVCGGGAHNPTIMKMLNEAFDGDVVSVNTLGVDGDFIEAEAFAYMAVRRLYDLPITFPGTTGIKKPATGGIINNP